MLITALSSDAALLAAVQLSSATTKIYRQTLVEARTVAPAMTAEEAVYWLQDEQIAELMAGVRGLIEERFGDAIRSGDKQEEFCFQYILGGGARSSKLAERMIRNGLSRRLEVLGGFQPAPAPEVQPEASETASPAPARYARVALGENRDESSRQYQFEDLSDVPSSEEIEREGYLSTIERDLGLINQDLDAGVLDFAGVPDSDDIERESAASDLGDAEVPAPKAKKSKSLLTYGELLRMVAHYAVKDGRAANFQDFKDYVGEFAQHHDALYELLDRLESPAAHKAQPGQYTRFLNKAYAEACTYAQKQTTKQAA